MAQVDFDMNSGRLERRRFLLTAALVTAAGGVIAGPAAQAAEAARTVPNQPTDGAWNMGLITAHRPELTAADNRGRMAELRAEIGDRFGLSEVRGRYARGTGPTD